MDNLGHGVGEWDEDGERAMADEQRSEPRLVR